MKKILLGVWLVLWATVAQAQFAFNQFQPLTTSGTAAGAWSSMPIDTTLTPGAASVSVTITAIGSASNRMQFECSNDVTFAGGGTAAGPNSVTFRSSNQLTANSQFIAPIALTVNRVYVFPIYARYCRIVSTTYVSGTDTAIVTMVYANSGPNVVEQGQASGFATAWPVATNPFPSGATNTTMANSGTTGAVTIALGSTTGKTTYLCGFDVSAIGGTAAIGPITIGQVAQAGTGSAGFTLTYQSSSTAGGIIISKTFTPCLPAPTTGTQITGTTTADGTATAVNFSAYGYIQ